MSRSLNKVQLIGNLTRDPELRYTPQGTAVCTFSVATNRQWNTDTGEKKEDVEYHRVVAWSKLAEICAQLLKKGRKVFIEGRLQTRTWEGQDGVKRNQTEIITGDMILLDSRGDFQGDQMENVPDDLGDIGLDEPAPEESEEKAKVETKKAEESAKEEDEDDIPF